jgi:hypothetical protein
MNKREVTLFNFGVKKTPIEGVCEATSNVSSTSSLHSDLQNEKKMRKLTAHRRKSLHTLIISTWTTI